MIDAIVSVFIYLMDRPMGSVIYASQIFKKKNALALAGSVLVFSVKLVLTDHELYIFSLHHVPVLILGKKSCIKLDKHL